MSSTQVMTSTVEQVLVELGESGASGCLTVTDPAGRAGRGLLQGRVDLLGLRPRTPRSARRPPDRVRRPLPRGPRLRPRRPDQRAAGLAARRAAGPPRLRRASGRRGLRRRAAARRHGRPAGVAGRRPQVPQDQEDPPGRRAADDGARAAGRGRDASAPLERAAVQSIGGQRGIPMLSARPDGAVGRRPVAAPTGRCCARSTAPATSPTSPPSAASPSSRRPTSCAR